MFDQLYTYMKEGKFTDVYFMIDDVAVGAHKNVLASSSKVFQAMFESEMKETLTQEVVLNDVDADAFRAFLDFIYTKNSENVGEHFEQLFMLADKYDVEPLAVACESHVRNFLTTDTAVKYLKIADLYHRDDLKKSLINFIKCDFNKIYLTDEWLDLKKQCPKLVSAVYNSMFDDRGASVVVDSYASTTARFSDANIVIEGEEREVEKFMLTRKSPEFSKLFIDNPEKGLIEGITYDTFVDLMDYCYFNKLPESVNASLLKAAVDFKLEELKSHLVTKHKCALTKRNAIPTLITAYTLRLDSLQTPAVELIVKNCDELKNSQEWADLFEYPDLMAEIFLKTMKC